ncbi:MAG: hypothetical protein GC146_00580 [Limimaricola sp.]|uniref:hypothetical protein n=1 Tax=Limimaricola sp. TaxID=2211665 RepID=UPI001D27B1EF|nr:hypothetical protein [Limimaricola sp.]MBI1415692.1 hypothetical protein [Limimaricola sp.]
MSARMLLMAALVALPFPALAADAQVTTDATTITVLVPQDWEMILPRPYWAPDGYDAHPSTLQESWTNTLHDSEHTVLFTPQTAKGEDVYARPYIQIWHEPGTPPSGYTVDDADYSADICAQGALYQEDRPPMAGQAGKMSIVVCGDDNFRAFVAIIGTAAPDQSSLRFLVEDVIPADPFDVTDRSSWPVSLDTLRARADAYASRFEVREINRM